MHSGEEEEEQEKSKCNTGNDRVTFFEFFFVMTFSSRFKTFLNSFFFFYSLHQRDSFKKKELGMRTTNKEWLKWKRHINK